MEKQRDDVMEMWERHYLHEKDKRDSQCLALGMEIPKDKAYGSLTIPKDLWREFRGVPFWKEFSKREHNHGDFKRCCCQTADFMELELTTK